MGKGVACVCRVCVQKDGVFVLCFVILLLFVRCSLRCVLMLL